MTETHEHQPVQPRLLVAAAVVPIVALGVIVTAVLLLLVGALGLVALVATAIIVAVRARALTRGIRDRVLGGLDPRPADAASDAGLLNLATGLSATSGVPMPDLFVIDEPGANMLVVGEASATPAVVVTSGLLGGLDRVQLEAVVSWAFAEMRQGELPAASVAVTTVARPAIALGGGSSGALFTKRYRSLQAAGYASVTHADRDLLLDQAAVSLTRYPPGLVAALAQMQRMGTSVARAEPESAHLWMADPGVDAPGMPERPSLDLRIEALRLL